ncbi:hypothetical protein GCM10010329_56580 [Streptomyces spiroverticillatus]|uniref:Uncharacterized protein n=1 Tax=Streptomyces finlayi TaxID=67296 RepID=A0A919CCJ8_9ACTN|nr:hypothetical protein [Streptomyces finlayi]GHA25885.1 hypothetical protein GCM10010329_56580 [Streptomyces spiroverticillatus]GHD05143.1 hypothetical protein GCM10010334_55230 [Streptomyces finlayi]
MTSSFENHRLNTMIDLVEAANPRSVAGAALALAGVREEFARAAVELRRRVGAVEWKGEAEREFHRFGTRLADHADDLGTYAGIVAGQLEEAAGGLTSVRNSLPPRSTSPDGGLPGGPDEPHRQEALNQLNRLASFYAVSGSTLASAEPPVLGADLRTEVPRPASAPAGGSGTGTPTSPSGPHTRADQPGPALPGPRAPLHASAHAGEEAAPHTQDTLAAGGLPHPSPATAPTQQPAALTTMELNSLTPGTQPAPPLAPPVQAQHSAPAPALGGPSPLPAAIAGGLAIPLTARSTAPPPPAYGSAATPTTPGGTVRAGSTPPTPPPRPLPGIPGVTGGTPARATSPTPRPAFTQGGTGLVRPQPTTAPRKDGRRRTGPQSRATEDPETWTSPHPPTTPAVIT